MRTINMEGGIEWTPKLRKTKTEVEKCYTQKHKDTKETSIQRKDAQDRRTEKEKTNDEE